MNGFECMLIKYPQRTQGQETVKTLQQKASWSRVVLDLKWQVQNITTSLNENGYAYLQAEKNGLLSENQRKLSVRFGVRGKKPEMSSCGKSSVLDESIEVVFYLLGAVSFVHKYNET